MMISFDHTIFKTPDGNFYGVSQRVMSLGYEPPEGTVMATSEERDIFIRNILIRVEAAALVRNEGSILKDDSILANSEELQSFKEHIKLIQESSSLTSTEKIESVEPVIKPEILSSGTIEQLISSEALIRSRIIEETVLKPTKEEKAAIRKARREAAIEEEKSAVEAVSQQLLESKIVDHMEIAKQEA